MHGARLNSLTILSSAALPLLIIITHGMLYAMEVCAANFYAGPARLNAATRSERPFAVSGRLRLPACCCYMRLFSRHKHAESHITVSFSPGKGADIFLLLGGIAIRCTKKRGGGSRSGMAFLTMALLQRGASVVVTMHLRGRFLGARGRPRSLANSLLQARTWEGILGNLELPHQQ